MTTINPLSIVSPTVTNTSTISPVGKIVLAAALIVPAIAGFNWLTDAITHDVAQTATCITSVTSASASGRDECLSNDPQTARVAVQVAETTKRF
ncbi:hypothetical protein [Microbacterium sp. HMWF026]|uniref:hypothetical protein n=1 Tax=Microbacterium sp. HMWF026 TaxID=2056861 RepID=UPI0011B1D957|nr:hypothetical protein [Microbacterium sp. HMWF026]